MKPESPMCAARKLPISAVIVTRYEERNITRCLQSLKDFSERIVVDSCSEDNTIKIARENGAKTYNFEWNGQYPKKRQWCLDHLEPAHAWIFFIDADEEVSPEFTDALKSLDWSDNPHAGYYVRGAYVLNGQVLKFGLKNNKLCLLHKDRMMFPVVNDLTIEGMGEIEGHYPPVVKTPAPTGQIKPPILHYAYEDETAWQRRHERYARWETEMDRRQAWPEDPRFVKTLFKALPRRDILAFLHSYILKLGFLDGRAGYELALSRYGYYNMIARLKNGLPSKASKTRENKV